MDPKISLEAQILQLTKELCSIASVSTDAQKENDCAQFIFHYLSSIEAAAPLTLHTELLSCEKDRLNRQAVLALLSSPRSKGRTILLTGHFDVVSAEVCGDLKEQAFQPELYTRLLRNKKLDENAQKDLESGNWLFGRGVMDMKGGLALFLAMIKEYAAKDCGINLLFLAVPDEENSSAGMRGVIRKLSTFIGEKNLDVIAAFTGEPCFRTSPDQLGHSYRPYYTGTTGKIMPFFYCVGKEAHVNDYFQGISAVLLASEIVTKMEADPDFLEGQGNWLLSPPACLGFEIRRSGYSVTIPHKSVCYFNLLTIEKTPQEILTLCKRTAERAIKSALHSLQESLSVSVSRGGNQENLAQVKIIDFFELYTEVTSQFKDSEAFRKVFDTVLSSQAKCSDEREESIRIIEAFLSLRQSTEPLVIIGFLPPYYPPRINKRRNA